MTAGWALRFHKPCVVQVTASQSGKETDPHICCVWPSEAKVSLHTALAPSGTYAVLGLMNSLRHIVLDNAQVKM